MMGLPWLLLLAQLSACSAIARQAGKLNDRTNNLVLEASDTAEAVDVAQQRVVYGIGLNQEATAQTADPDQSFRGVFCQSFLVVAVAELFDKTWFVAVICSLNHGKRIAFLGSSLALYLHVFVAAGLGATISRFFSLSMLHFVTAGVFGTLFVLYAREWVTADPDENALKGRSEEVKDAMPGLSESSPSWQKFMSCFMAVFVAEWGDRTQVAMISLHSSLPIVPVCLGSLAAFTALSANAVVVAALLEGYKLSERLICGMSAASFLVFAILALVDGLEARSLEHAVLT
mmetsp:Transcript_7754/g.20935  ORF Transcript_7754/g.20935 Transcript_7754/m.20935 type:complete len:288 (-) Transcript_7754:94-957(-)